MNILASLSLLKLTVLIVLALYGVLAYVIVNQVNTMNNILKEELMSTLLQGIAIIHLILVLSLFLFAFVIL